MSKETESFTQKLRHLIEYGWFMEKNGSIALQVTQDLSIGNIIYYIEKTIETGELLHQQQTRQKHSNYCWINGDVRIK